jgi:phosphate transport system permease protein
MSPSITVPPPASQNAAQKPAREARRMKRKSSLFANGEPMVWLTGGALALALCMITGLLALVIVQGVGTFWPGPVLVERTHDGRIFAGEVAVEESFAPDARLLESLPEGVRERARAQLEQQEGLSTRRMLRTGNFEFSGEHFAWVTELESAGATRPEWMLVVERQSWGRFYGEPVQFLIDGQIVAEGPSAAWAQFEKLHDSARERWMEAERLKREDIGKINARSEASRLALRGLAMEQGENSAVYLAAKAEHEQTTQLGERDFERVRARIELLELENARMKLVLKTADGIEKPLELAEIVRAFPANRLSFLERCSVYASRWREFLFDEPREANSEGGVFPAIFGTVAMTLIMTIVVVPFGVFAALYLREYAKPGPLVSFVRIAINNLAGVPSIVFGVFGLGFFCYIIGSNIDAAFFSANLPNPTFGKGGLLWASLTLALLTLPVVIVPTEEALSAVPSSMREGSYACGATKWQTIRRIVLPRAMPGIMTGAILALARGAGEVAPLMLVGAVKLAPELPIDGTAPFVHAERSFMHLGFHIFDLGFQSQNSEAAKPMVYTTTLLLIGIVVTLNLLAIWIRARLRKRFAGVQV